ncbi:unknown [Clostridium sp. CAG:715]|nr:unknown [Clostridium sp. CAG:715]
MSVLKEYYYTKKYPLILLILLILLAILLTFFIPIIPEKFVNALIASFSIFTALSFNLLLLLIDMIKGIDTNISIKSREDLQKLKLEVMNKCLKIISASILFSITDIILLLLISCDFRKFNDLINNINIISFFVNNLLIFLTYLFILLFFDSLYSILKIMHILITKEVDNKKYEFNKK